MKIKELRALAEPEIEKKIEEIKIELMKLYSQISTGTMPKNPGMVKQYKKTIAKINTIRSEKQLQK